MVPFKSCPRVTWFTKISSLGWCVYWKVVFWGTGTTHVFLILGILFTSLLLIANVRGQYFVTDVSCHWTRHWNYWCLQLSMNVNKVIWTHIWKLTIKAGVVCESIRLTTHYTTHSVCGWKRDDWKRIPWKKTSNYLFPTTDDKLVAFDKSTQPFSTGFWNNKLL